MTNKETYGIIGSSGQLEQYVDAYANVTDDDVQAVQDFEKYIREQDTSIQHSFLKIGAALIEVEKRKLYKAAGEPSMAAWMGSSKFSFSYAHGTRMMRIVRDLVPVLGTEDLPPVSTLKELLPMVSEGATPDEIREAAEEVSELTTQDAKKRLREIRGVEEKPQPTIFKAKVEHGDVYNRVTITCLGEDADFYEVGTLKIKPKHWARWDERFGGFLEYE